MKLAKIFACGFTLLGCLGCLQTGYCETQPAVSAMDADGSFFIDPSAPRLPCPNGFTVIPNPSVENSLSYLDESGKLAVSVTYIKQKFASAIDPENYARVMAQQMKCSIPVRSNLIADGWASQCEDAKLETVVYGGDKGLVLLAISGRNQDTEKKLEEFIDFLAYEAKK
ncbi:MAG: hypothetical protein J6O49_05925 [Bacteroidaceae bacterium]|nr:hypothetical protein [Bacteroidaceae bacterium]MBO6258752.1 hypothetical protein [Succinivibrio sp.]